MKIEIDLDEKKIILLESVNLHDFLDELEKMGIIDDRKYTIEVKIPPIVPWATPWNPIYVTPWHVEPLPWINPVSPTCEPRPQEPYYCSTTMN